MVTLARATESAPFRVQVYARGGRETAAWDIPSANVDGLALSGENVVLALEGGTHGPTRLATSRAGALLSASTPFAAGHQQVAAWGAAEYHPG